jgi:hypothetical protein
MRERRVSTRCAIPGLLVCLVLTACTAGIVRREELTPGVPATPIPGAMPANTPRPTSTLPPSPLSAPQPTPTAAPTSDRVPGLEWVSHVAGAEQIAVCVQGNYAYVSGVHAQELAVLDISDPANPAQVGSVALTGMGSASDVYYADGHVYVTAGGLQVVDVSDPTLPVGVGSLGTSGLSRGVTVAGDYAYIADFWSLLVVNVLNPATPTIRGEYRSAPEQRSSAYNVAIVANYAYVAGGENLQVVDVSDPAAPVEVGSVDTAAGGALDVAAAGSYVYVLGYSPEDDLAGVRVLDISDPAAPIPAGFYPTPGSEGPRALAAAGNYVYVAAGDAGLRMVDVSDPQNPTEISHYDTPGFAYDVAVAGDYVFVAGDGLSILRHVKPGS